MICMAKVKRIDESMYNYVRCPQCHSKIGWKPKDVKVRIIRLPHMIGSNPEPMGFTCKRCKSCYLITTESE